MGLAYESTGKYVSERHAGATAAGKLTAGQIAVRLRRATGDKSIKAAELKPFSTEWHHSGFYKGPNGRSGMGRTYFFSADTDMDKLYQAVLDNRAKAARIAAEADTERFFFRVAFRKRHGRCGGFQPVARLESRTCKPSEPAGKNAQAISKDDYELLKPFDGEDLRAYETASQFKLRMLS